MVFIILLIGILAVETVVILLWPWSVTKSRASFPDEPLISILIPVRNEQQNILRCLSSIDRLEYSKEKIEVLIGDDSSTDKTVDMIRSESFERLNIKIFRIPQNNLLLAKSRVLDYLFNKARGEYCFILDADMSVSPRWPASLLSQFSKNVALVNGVTGIGERDFFASLQNWDWLFSQMLIKIFSSLGKPITALGNNMGVRRSAYFKIGGFRNLPPAIIEDQMLLTAFIKEGFDIRYSYDSDGYGQSAPVSAKLFLQQRKRWVTGALKIPYWMQAIYFYRISFFPVFIMGFLQLPLFAAGALVIRILIESTALFLIYRNTKSRTSMLAVIFYDLYLFIAYLSTFVSLALRPQLSWKGRKYSITR